MRKILQLRKLFGWKLTRPRRMSILLMGIIAGTIMISPAGAHVGDSASHIWNKPY